MKQTQIKTASQRGILHHIVPLAIVVVFGIAGIGLLVSTHAATPSFTSAPAESSHVSGQSIPGSVYETTKNWTAYTNWSGYAATGKTFTKVYGALVVPKMTCPEASAKTMFWVGFDGFALTSNQTVEQVGIAAQCVASNASPQYTGFWEMRSNISSVAHIISSKTFALKPGQKIDEMVTYNRNGTYTLNLKNLATNKSFTTIQTCANGATCQRQSAEWIGERPHVAKVGYVPPAPWGSMQFTNIQAAAGFSSKMSPASSYYDNSINMIDANNKIYAIVGNLSKDGKSFTDKSQ